MVLSCDDLHVVYCGYVFCDWSVNDVLNVKALVIKPLNIDIGSLDNITGNYG